MSETSDRSAFTDRAVLRAKRDLVRLAPLVTAARSDPRSRWVRRRIETVRMRVLNWRDDPDELLDRIVAQAIADGSRPEG